MDTIRMQMFADVRHARLKQSSQKLKIYCRIAQFFALKSGKWSMADML
jgi:hypothetical protein